MHEEAPMCTLSNSCSTRRRCAFPAAEGRMYKGVYRQSRALLTLCKCPGLGQLPGRIVASHSTYEVLLALLA